MAAEPVAAGVWEAVVEPQLRPAVLAFATPRAAAASALFGALALAVLALAGPAITTAAAPAIAHRAEALRVLVVDASPAMNGRPMAGGVPYHERARDKLLDLLLAMPPGQTALIAYAGDAYLIVPPTTDPATVAPWVRELSPAVMPLPGERPERALRLAAELLAGGPAGGRDLVWLTAGAGLSPAARAALGNLAGSRLTVWQAGATATPEAGQALRAAAAAGGGLHLPLAEDDSDVRQIADLFAVGTRWAATLRQRTAPGTRDLGPWLLLLALPLAAWAGRGGLPWAARCLPLAAGGLSLLLAVPAPASATEAAVDRAAYRRFLAGDYAGAAARFADRRWQAVAAYRAGDYAAAAAALTGLDEADAHYNRGNALARLGDLGGALAAFEAALALRPDDADARHNRDLLRELITPPPDPPPPAAAPPERSPAAASPSPSPSASAHHREAEALARQWLRRAPEAPAGLLQRKLLAEHQRRQRAGAPEPGQ